MDILKKLTLKSVRLNIKRTIGTTIGIILSVALICAVAGMFSSLQATVVNNTIQKDGYYHILFSGIDEKKVENLKRNRDVKTIRKMYTLGYSEFDHEGREGEIPFIKVYSSDKKDFEELSFSLEEGRFPNSKDEIAISMKVLNNSNYKIGDEIELDIGTRMTLDGYELDDSNPYHEELERLENTRSKKYKIVGVVSKYGWNSIYYGFTTDDSSNDIKAFIALNNPKDYKKSLAEMVGEKSFDSIKKEDLEYDYSLNNELLRWELFQFSDSTITMLYNVIGVIIAIIVITSVFCIRNSFAISTTEKMKTFGMLASVGATKGQIKKMVVYEGLILGLIGIPLGIASGLLADFILVHLVNFISQETLFNTELVFSVSWVPIVLSVILGFLTIYLSSIFSAIRASKVSPIENLRNNKDVKLTSKKLKTPLIINRFFKTGGELAYKNLKRSKKKYRTTVISLAVSIFAFISLYSFIDEGFNQSTLYYTDYDYNIMIYDLKNIDTKDYKKIEEVDGVKETFYAYETTNHEDIRVHDLSVLAIKDENMYLDNGIGIELIVLDNSTFKKYIEKLKLKYEDMKNKVVLCDESLYYEQDTGKSVFRRAYKYKKGDTIKGTIGNENKPIELEIGAIAKEKPYSYEQTYYAGGYVVVEKDFFDKAPVSLKKIMVDTEKPDLFEKEIQKIDKDIDVVNFDEQAKSEKAMLIIMSIFLYGFITVITLIGITNIFNTITANMELRSKEFAMLKSIGMTKKEFNRMINLETIFYSSKSLVYGVTLGILGSFLVHRAFGFKNDMPYKLPYLSVLISIIFVFIIVYLIMKYSISRIERQNTIETIRKENV